VRTTDQQGSIAEASIAAAAIKLGIDAYKPLSDGTRSDLIFDLDGRLARVQCKWSSRYGDVIVIPCYSTRRAITGLTSGTTAPTRWTRSPPTARIQIDATSSRSITWPAGAPTSSFALHQSDNQEAGIDWARDYEFGATLARFGAVAQLGERRDGIAKAAGSSPAGSIRSAPFSSPERGTDST
jgi:hypothetical protein